MPRQNGRINQQTLSSSAIQTFYDLEEGVRKGESEVGSKIKNVQGSGFTP